MPLYLPVCFKEFLCDDWSVCLFDYLSVYLPLSLLVWLPGCLPVCQAASFFVYLSVYLSLCLFVWLYVYLLYQFIAYVPDPPIIHSPSLSSSHLHSPGHLLASKSSISLLHHFQTVLLACFISSFFFSFLISLLCFPYSLLLFSISFPSASLNRSIFQFLISIFLLSLQSLISVSSISSPLSLFSLSFLSFFSFHSPFTSDYSLSPKPILSPFPSSPLLYYLFSFQPFHTYSSTFHSL